MKDGMTDMNRAEMANDPQTYFTQVANHWDETRTGYFTEHMRDSAITKANLPANALVADIERK